MFYNLEVTLQLGLSLGLVCNFLVLLANCKQGGFELLNEVGLFGVHQINCILKLVDFVLADGILLLLQLLLLL